MVLSSMNMKPLPKDIMRQTEKNPVLLDGKIRLSGVPVKGGHVLWYDDISELTEILEELAEKQEDLTGENTILQENYKTELRIQQLEEKNRLYDKIHRQTALQITLLGTLLEQFEMEQREFDRKRLLQKMTVIGVYLKRRSNMIFMSEQSQTMHTNELTLCFGETMDALELSGITCGYYIAFEGVLPASMVMELYDFYEEVMEKAYDSLRAILIRIYENKNCVLISRH